MSEELLNQIFKCEVAKVHDYGAFVKIPDSKQQGLVHRSQVSSTRVDDVTEILQQGERVWCKIISINDGKIALSMKVVDQGSGIDLDPNGVQIHLDDQKRKKGPDGFKKRSIELGAVFNTTCAKCGTRGHLSKDCFKGADGKTYALVSEDEEADVIITPPEVPEKIKKLKKDKKEKKEKKKKKDKKLSKVEKKKKEEKKDAVKNGRKKHYKSKKRKRSVSTSSSSSSSSSSSDSLSSSSSEDSSSDSSTHRSKRKRKRKKSESKPKKKSRR